MLDMLKQHNQAFWVVFVYVLSSLFWKHWGHMHNMHVTWYRVTNVFNFLQGTQISSFYMNLIRTDAFLQKNYDNNEKYYRNSSRRQVKIYHPSYSPLWIRVLWNFFDKKWPTEVAGSHVTFLRFFFSQPTKCLFL